MPAARTVPQQSQKRARPNGRFKLAIFFINHYAASGKAICHYSTKRQDEHGKSINRLKYLIDGGYKPYADKVDWAAIYENEEMIFEFKDHRENNQRFWLSVSPQAS